LHAGVFSCFKDTPETELAEPIQFLSVLVGEVVLQSLSKGLPPGQPHVVRPVVSIENLDALLLAEICNLKIWKIARPSTQELKFSPPPLSRSPIYFV
jgi:hypothetical protein